MGWSHAGVASVRSVCLSILLHCWSLIPLSLFLSVLPLLLGQVPASFQPSINPRSREMASARLRPPDVASFEILHHTAEVGLKKAEVEEGG